MSDWVHSNVGAVTLYQRAGGTPTATTDAYYGGDIPFVTIEDITNGTRYLDTTVKNLSELGLRTSAAWLIKEPHILYSMYATVGKPIVNRISCATNQAIIALKPSEAVEQDFLFYQLLFIRPQVYKFTSQTTQSNLNASSVRKLPIAYPKSRATQRKIASILSTIDTAIEQTEALIEKYQHIKAGLMHDLFTRGVLPTGQLRPPREQAPELYQETAIGWIPREWEVSELEKACRTIVDCPHSTPSFQPGGVLVARTMHIKNGVFLEDDASRVSEKEYQERIARAEPTPGDVILTREAPVGEAFVIPPAMKICLGQRVMLLKPNTALLDSDYLVAQIYSGALSTRIAELTAGTTNPHLNVADVRSLLLALPPCEEQQELTRRINAMNAKIHVQQDVAGKLKLQKLGLMQDLLTGKVPVMVDAEALETVGA
jgi:type I restriction enzyme S subunit